LVVDRKSGTTKIGAVEFDPENLEAELEAFGKQSGRSEIQPLDPV